MVTLLERLEANYIPEPNSGCWLWTGALFNTGYGSIYGARGPYTQDAAHIVSYRFFVGPVPEGLELDHLCRVRCCINPAHLEPVTHLENMRRSPFPVLTQLGQLQAAKTHCPHGHPYSGGNLIIRPGGKRSCAECCRVRSAANAAAQKEQRAASKRLKTDFKCGHPYVSENILFGKNRPGGKCRTCNTMFSRVYRAAGG